MERNRVNDDAVGSAETASEAEQEALIKVGHLTDKAFAKRTGSSKIAKEKNKELSSEDTAMMIQGNFRAYLIRRSQALLALRDLAVAKSNLKELRA
ncbi:hypothetical protein RchiOBHm_Chr1g0335331 [Rosa chinensis]|uniref:Uncharacterized protein n=1 Tax=Rosa chinensis TaxID=74649 RepID=A0A2P6SCL7_ROSCH|nr:hypothetical protein RchiOBHm_Chr1g0335331 [Rosa chinensis]